MGSDGVFEYRDVCERIDSSPGTWTIVHRSPYDVKLRDLILPRRDAVASVICYGDVAVCVCVCVCLSR